MARTKGQHSLSFFKVIFGKNFDKLMYIPPEIAPLTSEMNGRKTYLKDSMGRKWKVSVSEVDGLLAFQQGWNDFFTGHNLEYGEFLMFLYMGTYFDVEVYGRTAVQRVNFRNSSQTKKRTRMDRQCSNLNDFPELTDTRSMKKEKSRKINIVKESDEQGRKSSARRLHTRKDQSPLKRDNVYTEKRKSPRFQDQSQSDRDSTETNGDAESPPLYRSRSDRSGSERNNTVERDDFEEITQSERKNVETDGGEGEGPSLYRVSKDGSESGRYTVEKYDFEETSQFKRQDVETDVGNGENSSSSCIKKAEIQPKRELFEDSFFGFAWEEVRNTHNEARTAVLDLSEFEVWGGCCTNQSEGIKAAAVRSGFSDKDQGTSSRDVRTNETSNCASEVAANVEVAGKMIGYKSKSDAPIATKKEKGLILSGDYPREPEPTTITTSSPVSAATKKEIGFMMPADHQEHEYNKRVPPAVSVSVAAVPNIKKEGMGANALPFNLVKNKTAQGAVMPVTKKEGMEAGAFRFNLTKNKPTAQEKPTIYAKTEPKGRNFY